jgi:F420-dependent oxidoreductase-like protein
MAKRLGILTGFAVSAAEREEVVQRVQVADDLGVDSAWVAEAWGRDAFTLLAELALKTKHIGLGTAIVNVFSRSAAVLAMTAASLDELSGGRMALGLGSSGANVIEHWHGVAFDKPLTRLREYVQIINRIVAGRRLIHKGDVFNLRRGFRLDMEPVRSHIPIFIAALSPRSIEQAGEVADGWIPIYWPKDRLREGIDQLMKGAERAGRQRNELTVAPSIGVYVIGEGDDSEDVRRRARQPIALYVGRMGVFYYQMLQRMGFEPEVAAIRAAWDSRDPSGAAAAVSDRMLDATAVVGSLEECREKLDEWRASGGDLPIINLPPASPLETGRILERLIA